MAALAPVSRAIFSYLRHAAAQMGLVRLRGLARAAADIVFPPSCLCCRKSTETEGALCSACWAQVRFIERPFCNRLGTPFAMDYGSDEMLSPEAVSDPPVYARARAVAHFDDGPVRQLVHRLKYYDRMELAKPIGNWMTRAGRELLEEAELLVPVPLHRARLTARRFNQAHVLAKAVSERCGVPVDHFVLARVKPTPPQVGLSRAQRALNLQGAFQIAEGMGARIEGRAIVLIDDVMTSGATANAASRALLRGGAKRVDVLVFARVV
ncbi:MAG TPA: ComF family protein [Methylocella sp.]|nr:ComF family protein [Methylocella sp.]